MQLWLVSSPINPEHGVPEGERRVGLHAGKHVLVHRHRECWAGMAEAFAGVSQIAYSRMRSRVSGTPARAYQMGILT